MIPQPQPRWLPRLQSQPVAQGTGTTPPSHEPLGGQDPTLHPDWKRSCVYPLGCLCPTPSPASLIVLPHLPFSSLQG